MRGLFTFILSLLILIALFFQDMLPDFSQGKDTSNVKINYKEELKVKIPPDAVSKWIGRDKQEFIQKWGEPDRIDSSAYGYDWYIYGSESSKGYMQAGIDQDKVVTIYVLGDDVNTEPFTIGEKSASIIQKYPIKSDVTLKKDGTFFRFELSEQEVVIRPLIQLEKNVWVQLYFDKFKNTLSSVRYLTPEVLLEQRPYSIVYRGELPKLPELKESEQKQVDDKEQLQIFEMTNVIRRKYGLPLLRWDEKTSDVAFLHSKDMAVQHYFSHESKDGRKLSDRLLQGGVPFSQAGENIAANYTDGIAAVEGWMNSEGHRKAILNKDYTHLGVGVYQKYYTQDFVVPME